MKKKKEKKNICSFDADLAAAMVTEAVCQLHA